MAAAAAAAVAAATSEASGISSAGGGAGNEDGKADGGRADGGRADGGRADGGIADGTDVGNLMAPGITLGRLSGILAAILASLSSCCTLTTPLARSRSFLTLSSSLE